jgi:hypothetical protein
MGLHICWGFAFAEVLGMALLDHLYLPGIVEFSHEKYGQLVVNILFLLVLCGSRGWGTAFVLLYHVSPLLSDNTRERFLGAA